MAVSPNSKMTGVGSVRTGGTTWYGADGVSWPVVAESGFTFMGDSLAAISGPNLATQLPSRTIYTQGVGGSITHPVAQRYGGFPVTVGVSGNQIPASGAVSITVLSNRDFYLYSFSSNVTQRVGIYGSGGEYVEGVLSYTPGAAGAPGTCTFTRDASGSAVNVAAAAKMVPVSASVLSSTLGTPATMATLWKQQLIIWTGRNDIALGTSVSQMVLDVDAMVRSQKTLNKRFLVIGVTASLADIPTAIGGQWTGSDAGAATRLTSIDTFNAALSAAYGSKYLDMKAALDALGAGYCTDYTILGTTYRALNATYGSDGIHPNSGAPQTAVAQIIRDKLITQLGW